MIILYVALRCKWQNIIRNRPHQRYTTSHSQMRTMGCLLWGIGRILIILQYIALIFPGDRGLIIINIVKMLRKSVQCMAMEVAEHNQKLVSLETHHISLICGVTNVKIRQSSGHFIMHCIEFTQRSRVDNFLVWWRIVGSNTWWYHMQHCDDPVRT